jgi:ABC-type multidrug transport system fused ATPase/permease subunit
VLRRTFPASDLVAFVAESNATISTFKRLFSTVTRTSRDLYHPVNGPMMLARFVCVEPSIGLSSPGDWRPADPAEAAALRWDIEFRGVHFHYPADKDAKEILGGPDGLNLKLPAGRSIGICGRTGCGKSTLLRLLERLYDVQRGEVLVGGRPIRSIEPRWLRAQISLVSSVKDTFVFNGSARDNIEFGAAGGLERVEEGERVARVQAAAEAADLWATIAAMPNGLDTPIGQRSEQDLSDGQTQRLSIARGLINEQCRLLLLDEPTSAVDGPTETKIMASLDKRRAASGCGQVMVAHRMSTLTKCDSIVFMINPAADALSAVCRVLRQIVMARPLAPPYSLYTVLLKVSPYISPLDRSRRTTSAGLRSSSSSSSATSTPST